MKQHPDSGKPCAYCRTTINVYGDCNCKLYVKGELIGAKEHRAMLKLLEEMGGKDSIIHPIF